MGKAPSGRVVGLDDWENVVNMGKKRGRKKKKASASVPSSLFGCF